MKKYFLIKVFAAVALIGYTGCSDSDNEETLSEKEKKLQTVNTKYVEAVVIPIYKNLADRSLLLEAALKALTESPSDANVAKACTEWKASRQYWEWSEAFLFGAASKYNIDPHIDTWPLDKTQLENLLESDKMMSDIENTVANLNNGLVGYHGLEYIIFREGQQRRASDITEKERRYALAVAQDLTLSCCRLEAAWAGMDALTSEKQAIIEDAEMEPEDNFGEQMELAGFAGSIWKTVTLGSEQIIAGCRTIVDEVGNMKIGAPYTGEDVTYIESPHAYNSIQDFKDNITGVQYAYYGAMGADAATSTSISAFIQSVDAAADNAVKAALAACIAKIDAMPRPFVLNYSDPKVGEAIDACNALDAALQTAQAALTK
ncbi:MAG: hypothetical protein LBR84_09630 [Tannerella sp.]|jgi:uncharacterized iron-regulated protein|nr:hypothetical protein [Tannerella sp.]